MEILEFEAGTGGAWGDYGAAGWWYPAGPGGQSLPAGVASIVGATTSQSATAAGDSRNMALPPAIGGTLATNWLTLDGYSEVAITTSGPVDLVVSWRLIAMSANRPGSLSILSPGGATLVGPVATPDLFLGVWARVRITGSCKLYCSGSFPRYQGAILKQASTSPSGLVCIQPGLFGLIG